MIGPLRYCSHVKHINYAPIIFNSQKIRNALTGLVNRASYSQDKKGCCKDVAQTTGKKVEPWPKSDPPPAPWRAECPQEPQPPNYDPYRIKVPDVVVPPLPASNVKRTGVVFTTTDQQGGRHESAYHHQHHEFPKQADFQAGVDQRAIEDEESKQPGFFGRLKGFFGKLKDYWKEKPAKRLTEAVKEVLPKLGYHGKNKYKYAFHEPWKPLDRMTLLEEAEKQELEQSEDLTVNTDKQGL